MSLGLPCPKCGSETSVKDSRGREDGSIRRRRLCGCGHRFTTLEVAIEDVATILHREGVLQPHVFHIAAATAGLLGVRAEQDRAVVYALAHRLAGKDIPVMSAARLPAASSHLAAAE